jgi:hypothetical protein
MALIPVVTSCDSQLRVSRINKPELTQRDCNLIDPTFSECWSSDVFPRNRQYTTGRRARGDDSSATRILLTVPRKAEDSFTDDVIVEGCKSARAEQREHVCSWQDFARRDCATYTSPEKNVDPQPLDGQTHARMAFVQGRPPHGDHAVCHRCPTSYLLLTSHPRISWIYRPEICLLYSCNDDDDAVAPTNTRRYRVLLTSEHRPCGEKST